MYGSFDWGALTEIQYKDVLLSRENCRAFRRQEKWLKRFNRLKRRGLSMVDFMKECYLLIGRGIYECKSLQFWSGLCSENVIKEIESKGWSKAKKTREHALGRGNCAKMIYEYARDNKRNLKGFKELFVRICFYHWTTYEENNKVKTYIDSGMDWISAYEKVGIVLYRTIIVKEGGRNVIKEKIKMSPAELRANFAY